MKHLFELVDLLIKDGKAITCSNKQEVLLGQEDIDDRLPFEALKGRIALLLKPLSCSVVDNSPENLGLSTVINNDNSIFLVI